MAETIIQQPKVIDAAGNINVHGRGGIRVPITFRDAQGADVDATNFVLYFEVDKLIRKPLEPAQQGDSVGTRWLAITQNECARLPLKENALPFAVVDETTVELDGDIVGRIRWSGKIWRVGYNKKPTDSP